ncbi:MAG: GNAT family N-acetyltransferase [Succinivibrio sp.]|nr:GNAT family N-acetyltransferase [Succinivibrio sp.]
MIITDGVPYLPQVKELLLEYLQRLNRDLSFQDIDAELADPRLKYTAPAGELLVAVDTEDRVLGMVAYHRHSTERCEMKRLYVRPDFRHQNIGEALITAILAHAREAGYREMVLDTVRPLKAAISLYHRHGFVECAPYCDNPMDDVIYMAKSLV